MNYNLSDLLEAKAFDALLPDEQAFVLEQMSAEAYTAQHELVCNAQEFLKAESALLVPYPETQHAALDALREKNKKKRGGALLLWQNKVPTWMAVAACLLILLLSQGYSYIQHTDLEKIPIVETISDTVYVEKLVTKQEKIYLPGDTVVKVVYQKSELLDVEKKVVPTESHSPEKMLVYSDEMLNANNLDYGSLLMNHSKPKGISAKNDSLMRMVSGAVH